MMTLLAVAALVAQAAQNPTPAALNERPKAPTRATAVEHITVHGKSLEGNLEADSADRDVTVYLPPSYSTDKTRRYPVVYLLHGYGGRDDTFNGRLATLPDSADRDIANGKAKEMIVVMPNKRPAKLDEFDELTVQLANDFWGPILFEQSEFVVNIDFFHGGNSDQG